jgi:S-adenosylmethionine:tRNA ribosyltransferase-isomerase
MQAAYAHAITNEYRFYSYGDSSLLLPLGSGPLKSTFAV